MKLKPKLLPYMALGAGLLGCGLRIWLFTTGRDAGGLLSLDHPANTLTYILIAVTLLLLLLGIRPLNETPAYHKLFPYSIPAGAGCFIAATGILISTFSQRVHVDFITVICCVFGVLSAAALVTLGGIRLKQMRPRYYLHGIVTAYMMVRLVCQYRSWNMEPELQSYLPQLLASIFLMIGGYYRTMLDAGTGCRSKYVFFNSGAFFFCCICLYGNDWLFYLAMAMWTATGMCSLEFSKPLPPIPLPANVLYCMDLLEKNGHSVYIVGGCVRDFLLNLNPQDYDLCTSATPEQICALFSHHTLVRSGEKHGTIGIALDGAVYEITTFRREGSYSDSRHPDWVEFVPSVEEDLARRDFTVNAMAYSPSRGYVDPFGGRRDLTNRILRTVGDPETRFREDALRILRGVRFAVRFRMTPEAETQKAMFQFAPLMEDLARERVFSELCKLLPHVSAQDLLKYTPILTQIIPELAPTIGFQQHSTHHSYDVFTHIAHTVEAVLPDLALRFAALLHDIGKPATFSMDDVGNGHFYGHAKVGAELADAVLLRLKAPNALRKQVVFLVAHHMTPFEPDKKALRRRLGKYGEDTVIQLIELQKADFGSKGISDGSDPFTLVEQLLAEIQSEDSCLTVKDLAIDGHDLLSLGTEPGPHIGQCMAFLLELVHEEIIANTKEDLLLAANQYLLDNQEVSQ